MSDTYSVLFGDIHNHNALGYGIGSLERSIDIARTHLDFFAFTGHSSWHDMETMEGGREQHWLKGFKRLSDGWSRVQSLIADANRADEFAAFLGFEWHSSFFGDQCVVFPEDNRPLVFPDHIDQLRQFCIAEKALMIPHHLAYPSGRRGVNWDVFHESCTPVVEIYSEHGNSEDDRGAFPFVTHSMGGRQTSNTVRAALAQGLRFGFVASSDSHSGFPGAYGEGVMAALVREHDRASILEAINSRRTYALTGDRIVLDFTVDEAPMGASITADKQIDVSYAVAGRDELDVVEVIQDGAVVHRSHPQSIVPLDTAIANPFQLRLEWGWGPWGDLALERVTDWEFDIRVTNGRLVRWYPCLQSGPFDEERRHRFQPIAEEGLHVTSYTSRRGAFHENSNQSLVLELTGGADTGIELVCERPVAQTTTTTVGELYGGSVNRFVGPFPDEAYQWHRLIPQAASALQDSCVLDLPDGPSSVYLRVRQRNGQMAWASPVFINYDETRLA
ncbi:MAG: hypothetical protein O7B98_08505 [Alphaproteobacteria bacterium]|nr:hypothetical protein [Alphaproteobacteria bacterium]